MHSEQWDCAQCFTGRAEFSLFGKSRNSTAPMAVGPTHPAPGTHHSGVLGGLLHDVSVDLDCTALSTLLLVWLCGWSQFLELIKVESSGSPGTGAQKHMGGAQAMDHSARLSALLPIPAGTQPDEAFLLQVHLQGSHPSPSLGCQCCCPGLSALAWPGCEARLPRKSVLYCAMNPCFLWDPRLHSPGVSNSLSCAALSPLSGFLSSALEWATAPAPGARGHHA